MQIAHKVITQDFQRVRLFIHLYLPKVLHGKGASSVLREMDCTSSGIENYNKHFWHVN
jgi:hypothetical protein